MLYVIIALLVRSCISEIAAPGFCTMRGQCGKESFFSPELPCPYDGKATAPGKALKEALARVCGASYASDTVCCDLAQVKSLESSLKRAENLIASCPACQKNFFDFFCTFTCSPDQAQFLRIEETKELSNGNEVVTHLSHYVDTSSANAFYDSCKNVKFSATNGFVMDLIGGGAKNASEFMRFLGHKSLLGSPIQIDYPDTVPDDVQPVSMDTVTCADPDYRCACVDCPDACPILDPIGDLQARCHVGRLPCLSFAVIVAYSTILLGFVSLYIRHIRQVHRLKRQPSRLVLDDRRNNDDLDDHDSLLAPEHEHDRSYALNDVLQRYFYDLGLLCAKFPYASIGVSIFAVGLISLGMLRFHVETDPVKLWVAPSSVAAQEKSFYDENFGPFYRAQQMFLTNATHPTSSVLSYENLKWWFELENEITGIITKDGIKLSDICLKPTDTDCVIQSVTGYFQSDFSALTPARWAQDLQACFDQPVNCLPAFQQPLKPNLVIGGYGDDFMMAEALVSSIVVKNSLNSTEIARAESWENALVPVLLRAQEDANSRGLRLSFRAEVSLEQELNKSTNTDARIIIVSYVVMFVYAAIALGGSPFKGRRSLIDCKVSLGFFGIIIVLLSILASVGLFSLLGVSVTLIIAEVIPFLVLAVGVDNIFLLCHEFERVNFNYNEKDIEDRVALTLSRVGPSILLSASTETAVFAVGAFVGMPAVRNFALYAAGAVLFNAILQLTMFPAAMTLDQLRVESNRVDCIPLIRLDVMPAEVSDTPLEKFIRKRYAPYLMRPYAKAVILAGFLSATAVAIALLPQIQLGLDQKQAIPQESYLVPYFEDLEQYFETGPPVYFVAKHADASDRHVQQALCGRFTTCQQYSLSNVLEQERKRPEASFLLEPSALWLDDFLYWLNPQLNMCCRKKIADGSFCTADDPERLCQPCFADREIPWNITLTGMPEGEEFMQYLKAWLSAESTEDCPLAGKAPYSDAISLDPEEKSILASNVRSFHLPLRTQQDFINSYAAARRVANDISKDTGLDIFPYAVHYIFFDQYSTIIRLAVILISVALLMVLAISTALLGSITAASLITLTVLMIILDIAGIMALWGISLNALSLVNLIICIGIGVEFCSHFARAYMIPHNQVNNVLNFKSTDREQRVWAALDAVGASVFTGITLCKFVGISVLAFTRSKIFEIYYFRMWLSLVIIAASHGLVFLPVLFSVLGPEGYTAREVGEILDEDEWNQAASGRYLSSLLLNEDSDGSF